MPLLPRQLPEPPVAKLKSHTALTEKSSNLATVPPLEDDEFARPCLVALELNESVVVAICVPFLKTVMVLPPKTTLSTSPAATPPPVPTKEKDPATFFWKYQLLSVAPPITNRQ